MPYNDNPLASVKEGLKSERNNKSSLTTLPEGDAIEAAPAEEIVEEVIEEAEVEEEVKPKKTVKKAAKKETEEKAAKKPSKAKAK